MLNSFERLQLASVNAARKLIYGAYGLPSDVARRGDARTCFVLGHMRSGSSLLMRLLSTSPEVLENGELMLSYRNRWDFTVMRGRLLWSARKLFPDADHGLWVDKLLHNYGMPKDNVALLVDQGVKVVFLIRPPERTISSIAANFHNYTVDEAAAYYIERLEKLSEYAKILGPGTQAVGIEYGDILSRSELVFPLLESYLELDTHLDDRYDVPADRYGRGDPSVNLSSGRILSDAEKETHTERVPSHLLEQADQAYEKCRQAILTNCRTID